MTRRGATVADLVAVATVVVLVTACGGDSAASPEQRASGRKRVKRKTLDSAYLVAES